MHQNAGYGAANGLATASEAPLELPYSGVVLRCSYCPLFDSVRRFADRLKDLGDETCEPRQSCGIRNARSAEEDDTTLLMCLDETVGDVRAVLYKLH
jgi:hypothetical protein